MSRWDWMRRLVLGPRREATLSVLIFHRVRRERDPLRPGEPTAEEFDRIIGFLARHFHTSPLYDGVVGGNTDSLPAHRVAVTFDDGYADNYEVALPILRRHEMPATFFIASGLIDGGLMWNDQVIESVRRTEKSRLDLSDLDLPLIDISGVEARRAAIRSLIKTIKYRPMAERLRLAREVAHRAETESPQDLMMTSDQVRALAKESLAEIGGHTLSHPILTQLQPTEAAREIREGKEKLETMTGQPLRCFAYPNGVPGRDFNSAHVRQVREAGFEIAVTTSPGGVRSTSDRYQLPRFTPWEREPWRFALRMLYVARRSGERAE